jgi:hypothetical protein
MQVLQDPLGERLNDMVKRASVLCAADKTCIVAAQLILRKGEGVIISLKLFGPKGETNNDELGVSKQMTACVTVAEQSRSVLGNSVIRDDAI